MRIDRRLSEKPLNLLFDVLANPELDEMELINLISTFESFPIVVRKQLLKIAEERGSKALKIRMNQSLSDFEEKRTTTGRPKKEIPQSIKEFKNDKDYIKERKLLKLLDQEPIQPGGWRTEELANLLDTTPQSVNLWLANLEFVAEKTPSEQLEEKIDLRFSNLKSKRRKRITPEEKDFKGVPTLLKKDGIVVKNEIEPEEENVEESYQEEKARKKPTEKEYCPKCKSISLPIEDGMRRCISCGKEFKGKKGKENVIINRAAPGRGVGIVEPTDDIRRIDFTH